jgi:hypothetical protein
VYAAASEVCSERELGQVIAVAVIISAPAGSGRIRAPVSERWWVVVDGVLVLLALAAYPGVVFGGAAARWGSVAVSGGRSPDDGAVGEVLVMPAVLTGPEGLQQVVASNW